MTEDEAKTKVCPDGVGKMSRIEAAMKPPNFVPLNVYQSTCIGSACMAWRRQTVMIDRETGEPAIPGVSKLESLEARYSAHGYCGRAGAPT